MATQTTVTPAEDNSDKALETKVENDLPLGLYEVSKIGKRASGTAAVLYKTWQIEADDVKITDIGELTASVLAFLKGDFGNFKKALINGANQQARFLDAPGSDPFEQLEKFMTKKGMSLEEIVAHFSK